MTQTTIEAAARKAIVEKHRTHENDTGSPQVQIALLTQRINHINEHMQRNKKDYHSQRGLLKMVGRRNRLLRYLRETQEESYKALIEQLGLRK
ncbi:MAG: 30S ribosomal protein S15 [Planctomycetota bacterium]